MAAQLRAVVDKLLSNVSNGLFQDEKAFCAERFLTNQGVKQNSGIIGSHGTSHLRIHANAMGGEGKAPRVSLLQIDLSKTYLVKKHGLKDVVTEEDYDNYDAPFEAERDKTILLSYANLVAKEYGLANAMGATAAALTQNTTLTGSSQWSDFANSDPISVIKTARKAVRDGCGFWPNTALIESAVYETLRVHPQIWDRLGFKYNQSGQLTQDNVASALNVKKLLVADGVYDSSSQGQTAVMAPIWAKSLFLAQVAENAALKQKSLGYHVFKTKDGVRKVYKYAENNPPESTALICTDNYDMLLSDVTCAYAVYEAIA